MPYSLEYFNERVLAEIERWPVGVLADYARIVELLVVLHAFVKKTQATPERDLRIARRRMKEVCDG